jgi:hypothetical protein
MKEQGDFKCVHKTRKFIKTEVVKTEVDCTEVEFITRNISVLIET